MTSDRWMRGLGAAAITAVALAGCGGGSHAEAPGGGTPETANAAGTAGVVAAERTHALIGPAIRATRTQAQRPIVERGTGPHPRHHGSGPPVSQGVAGETTCPDSGLMPAPGAEGRLRAAVVCLLNAERAVAGLPGLSNDSRLAQAAAGMGQQMVKLTFFSHTMPDGTGLVARVRPTGYLPSSGDWVLGENLAWGSGALSTPAAIVQGWMNSPGHRANVLAPDYRDVGMGVVMGSPTARYTGGTVYVADFGSRATAAASSAPGGSGNGSRSGSASTRNTPRVVHVPVRCRHACVVTARVYWRHRRVGSGERRLRHGGRARVRVHLSRRLRHARLTALTHVRGKRGSHRAVVRTP